MATSQAPPRSRRTPSHEVRFRLVALAVIVIVVVAVAVAITAYVVVSGRQKRDVSLPADSATPAQVVRSYLDALDARDCDTAEALAHGAGRSWCRAVSGLDEVRVLGSSTDGDSASVEVTFDLRKRLFSGDPSLSSGPMPWGYVLERNGAGAWRITDQGMG